MWKLLKVFFNRTVQFWNKTPFLYPIREYRVSGELHSKWWTYINQSEHSITVLKFWITLSQDALYACLKKSIPYVIYSNVADSFSMFCWFFMICFSYFVNLFIQYDESISKLSKSNSIIRLECFYGPAVVKSIIIHGQSFVFLLLNIVYFKINMIQISQIVQFLKLLITYININIHIHTSVEANVWGDMRGQR